MYKIFDKTGLSYDDVSRFLYGDATRAGDLSKINNATNGEIIVFDDDNLDAQGQGIRANIGGLIYNDFCDDNTFLQDAIGMVRGAVFIFEGPPKNRFKIGQNASVYDDNGLFLNGNVKNIIPVLDDGISRIRVEVKSQAGVLIDSAVPFPLEFKGISLKKIITNICNYYGITVNFADDARLDSVTKTEIDNSFTAHLDESAWDYLTRITNSKGLLIQDFGDSLYVGNVDTDKVKISFLEGKTIGITSWRPEFKTEKLARYYEAHTQYPVSASAVAQLPIAMPTTTRLRNYDTTEGNIQTYADWGACRAVGDAYKFRLTADDSFKLKAGDMAAFLSPTCQIFEETKVIIEKIIKLYPIGFEFVLTLPCAYTGEIPESLPLC